MCRHLSQSRRNMMLFLTCIVFASLSQSSAINPGFRTRISKDGIYYANQVAIDILTKDILSKSIPDQHGSQKVSGIHVDYDLTGMRIRSFSKPSSAVQLNPGSGVTWSISGGSCSAHGDWHYKAKKSFIRWSDSGSFDLSVSGMRFSVSVSMGVDSHGRPTIHATSCTADAGSVDVKFHGGASWLYNLFSHYVEKSLKDQLNDVLCKAAVKAINENAQQSLSSLDIVTKLGSDLSLDFSLTDKPTFSTDALVTSHKGEIFFAAARKPAPFQASPLPPPTGSKMMTVWLSDYIVNTAGYAAQTNNILQYNLTAKDLSPDDASFLNTTCTLGKNCFGKIIPLLNKLYPNKQVELDMYSTSPPKATVMPGKINLTFSGNLEVRLSLKNGSRPFLFSANATMTTNVRVFIENNVIKGNVQNTRITTHIVKASITNDTKILERTLKFAMKFAAHDFIDQQLNGLGNKGIPIPMVSGVQFLNSQIVLVKNAIQVEADVHYTPPSAQDVAQKSFTGVSKKYGALKFKSTNSHLNNVIKTIYRGRKL